jgi:hypothetical protein
MCTRFFDFKKSNYYEYSVFELSPYPPCSSLAEIAKVVPLAHVTSSATENTTWSSLLVSNFNPAVSPSSESFCS